MFWSWHTDDRGYSWPSKKQRTVAQRISLFIKCTHKYCIDICLLWGSGRWQTSDSWLQQWTRAMERNPFSISTITWCNPGSSLHSQTAAECRCWKRGSYKIHTGCALVKWMGKKEKSKRKHSPLTSYILFSTQDFFPFLCCPHTLLLALRQIPE